MAATAAKKRKKPKSYASAVRGAEEKNDFFTLAKCNLKQPEHMPNGRIPNTTEAHSFFVDLKSTDATNAEVLNAINTAGIIGANVRDDLWVIEFVCKDDASVEKAMNTAFTVEGKKPFVAIIPRHKTNKTILIKIANMPFGQEDELRAALVNYWSTLGKVIDAQPYMFPGRPWLTKRWDLLLQLPDGTKDLKAPPIFALHGYTDTIISSWNGAKKACLHCKIAGHSTSKCPLKKPGNQKVGESANPLQKIDSDGQSQKRKNKGSEVSPGSAGKTTASGSSVTPVTQSAISASPATVAEPILAPSGNFTLEVQPPPTAATSSAVPTPTSASAGSEKERILVMPRPSTPPTTQSLPDPDTPRKGRKRMSKAEDWPLSKSMLYNYLEQQLICIACWQRHSTNYCESGLPIPQLSEVPRLPQFQPYLQRWMLGRKKRGSLWRLDHDDVAGGPGPDYCDRCEELGHTDETCPANVKCIHCGGAHESLGCKVNPFAVLGDEEHMEE